MSNRHDNLMNNAFGAINRVFQDTSVDKQSTMGSLMALRELVDDLLSCVRDDLRAEAREQEFKIPDVRDYACGQVFGVTEISEQSDDEDD